jgi:xanthine dehydrogenase YagR molybdenum-binding subunit
LILSLLFDKIAPETIKETGKAKYTAEYNLPNMAYGVFVPSSIAKGTIKNLDTATALASPGV